MCRVSLKRERQRGRNRIIMTLLKMSRCKEIRYEVIQE